MKQYILKYQDFLNIDESVLTKSESEKYSKIQVVEDVKAIHTKIFGDGERIYIPFDFSHLASLDKSKTQKRVEYILSKNGYEIVSYEQNQCKKINDSRLTSIAKVLQSKNVNKPDLAVDYGQDVEKSRNLEPTTDMYVCISRNSDDIASMSTGRSWTSCQDIRRNTGYNHYVAKDLEHGSIIAYLIKSTDREIEDPESRILIKPFINTKDSKDIVLLPSTVSYYRGKNKKNYTPPEKYPNFYKFLMSWVKMVQPDMNGSYQMQSDVYQDGSTSAELKRDLTPEEMERVEEPQTKEDLKLAFDYYDLDFSKVQFDEDGFVEYNGSLYLRGDFNRLPKLFAYIYSIKGNLDLIECTRLKSFKNLENLRSVKRILTVQEHNNIKDTKALEKLEDVSKITPRNLFISYMEIKNPKFKESLENPKTEEDYLNILRFYDIEDVDKDSLIIKDGVVSYDTIKFIGRSNEEIKSVLKHFNDIENLKFFNCDGLKDFTEFENIKKIDKLTIVSCLGLESLKGLDNCEILEFDLSNIKVLKNFIESNEKLKERIYTNPQTHEDLGLLLRLEGYYENTSTLSIDENGLWSLNENLYIISKDFTEFPKIFNRMKASPYIRIDDCNNIKDFSGLENVKSIGLLEIVNCKNLENFSGLENSKLIDLMVEGCSNIKSLEGLPKNLDIGGIQPQEFRKEYIIYKYPDWKERIENPKSVEDFEIIKNVDKYVKDLDLSKIKFYTDGLVIYDGHIDFSNDKDFKEFPKWMSLFKEIHGSLNCSWTSITDFTGLEKLTKIGGSLDCPRTSITSFKGLKNLESIGGNLYCSYTSITGFTGLNNLTKIGGSLHCAETSITDFTGLENLENIGGGLYCAETSITDFTGLENLESIGGSLYCSYSSITDFTGLENLKSIDGELYCSGTPLKSFKGLEQCKLNPDYIQPKKFQEKYKEWKETLKQS